VPDTLVDALDRALEALLDARIASGTIRIAEAPEGPIDAALSIDARHKAAKAATRAVEARLRPLCSPEVWREVLAHEAAIRAEYARVTDLAFAVGMTATGHR
jgi:hypothetical protein